MNVFDGEQYPLTDSPDYTTKFDTFAELREAVEATDEGLNHVASWSLITHPDGCLDFGIALWMPRKSQTCQFETNDVEPAAIKRWLIDYTKPRIDRWYGFAEGDQ